MKKQLIPSLSVPIQRIILVDEITRHEVGPFRSDSTPAHLLHIVEAGQVRQRAEGRIEAFREGDVVWYHQSEPIRGRIIRAPWRFLTINFAAPALAPPSDDQRVLKSGPRTLLISHQLLDVWRDNSMSSTERGLRCTALLIELLLDFRSVTDSPSSSEIYPLNARERWWAVERLLRQRLEEPIDLATMARFAGLSVRTTIRACQSATGQSPAKRLKILRLTHGRNLLQHTDLPVTEVAFRVGCSRVQEFCRDMRKNYNQTPREIRTAFPDYLGMSKS